MKNPSGSWTFFHPTGVYTNDTPESLLEILIKFLNELYESEEKVEEEYLDFSLEVERILNEEYNGSNIPVWKQDYIKDLSYKLGVSIKRQWKKEE